MIVHFNETDLLSCLKNKNSGVPERAIGNRFSLMKMTNKHDHATPANANRLLVLYPKPLNGELAE